MQSLQTFLFVIQIIISALLILIVVSQKSDEDALSGIGGGASHTGLMPHKMVANALTKMTMILFTIFMINSLLLATISARNVAKNKSLIEQYIQEDTPKQKPAEVEIPEAK